MSLSKTDSEIQLSALDELINNVKYRLNELYQNPSKVLSALPNTVLFWSLTALLVLFSFSFAILIALIITVLLIVLMIFTGLFVVLPVTFVLLFVGGFLLFWGLLVYMFSVAGKDAGWERQRGGKRAVE